jgi:4-hydroxythreonine-4-phosphate dehydrogenase
MKLGITLGDPGGIGPEVVFKSLAILKDELEGVDVILFGPKSLCSHLLVKQWLSQAPSSTWIDAGPSAFQEGRCCKENGEASLSAIQTAVKAFEAGDIQALVTAPICKESMTLANAPAFDHTTLLKHLTKTADVRMAFYSPTLKTVLHTTHIPFSQVPQHLTEDSLGTTLHFAHLFAKKLGITHPKIALAGLNPHAGENGLMGHEEEEILKPFVKRFSDTPTPISGPYPPDTLYHHTHKGLFDVVISLYHDQGLIPVKLLAFDSAVNVTLGLPFIRTSPDHGTAFDIAYQNKANSSSMTEAIRLALKLRSS